MTEDIINAFISAMNDFKEYRLRLDKLLAGTDFEEILFKPYKLFKGEINNTNYYSKGIIKQVEKNIDDSVSSLFRMFDIKNILRICLTSFAGKLIKYDKDIDLDYTALINERGIDMLTLENRIKKWQNQILIKLMQKINISVARGVPLNLIATELHVYYSKLGYIQSRILRTEFTRCANEILLELYRILGINKVLFDATLDDRTSKICRSLDGSIFTLKQLYPHLNIPPLHPNCRSLLLPVIDS